MMSSMLDSCGAPDEDRRARPSSWPTTCASRSACASAAVPSSLTTSGFSAAATISSSRIDSAVSGVRSWCEASTAKSCSAEIKSVTRWAALSSPSATRSSSAMPYLRPTGLASPDPIRSAALARSWMGLASRRAGAMVRPAATTNAINPSKPTRTGDKSSEPNPPLCHIATTSSPATNTRTATSTAPIIDISRRRWIKAQSPVSLRSDPSPRSLSALEPESDAADSGDEMRVVGVVTELAAEPGHVHVQRLGRPPPLAVPDLPHDLIPGDHLARLGHQQMQQVEFLRRQVELCLTQPCPAGVIVDPHSLD